MSRRKLDQRKLVTAALRQPRLDQRQIAAARLWAVARFPYLAAAVFGLELRQLDRPGTVASDEHWRLYIDPDLPQAWSTAQFAGLLIHHANHLLRDHADRARAFGVRDDQQRRWVISADAEINDDLVHAGIELPDDPVLPRALSCEDNQLAEQYFQSPWPTPNSPDCGSGTDGIARGWDLGPGNIPPAQRELLRYKTAAEVIRHADSAPGSVPGGLMRWAQTLLASRTDWRKELHAEIRRGVAAISGLVDYTYRRPSRRSLSAAQVIMPSFARPIPELAVVIDTSASMDEQLLGRALGEVDNILRRLGQRRTRVIPCDSAAKGVQRVRSVRTIELIGGGGTDMGQGIAAAQALRPPPNIVVILTDGHTPWPQEPPQRLRVVVGLLASGSSPPPAWARTVRIDRAV